MSRVSPLRGWELCPPVSGEGSCPELWPGGFPALLPESQRMGHICPTRLTGRERGRAVMGMLGDVGLCLHPQSRG